MGIYFRSYREIKESDGLHYQGQSDYYFCTLTCIYEGGDDNDFFF